MKYTGYIIIYALDILWQTGSSAKLDSYDPTTAMFRWIITNEKK